ncbi:probable serine/threonine-protein kinase abkC isoform X3 [Hibiscus syriacus]|uniref:probable serine/threonine-protein kinase abkC isoform X3 n=1 Tax=Hibiscus syriacus TaxID=106335 RepID=UPI001924E351|nr:probable serine/threonine-protein kinase abkC isoform X3 [Hibiscus syriacus]
MSRLLTFANIRKAAASATSTPTRSHSEFSKYGPVVTIGLRLLQYRVYSHCRFNIGGQAPLFLHNTKEEISRGSFSRYRSFLSASSAVTHNAQVAWKKLTRKCSSSCHTLPCMSRIAQAVSLALFRSHLIVPGIFGLGCGRLALAQRKVVETDYFLSPNSLYIRAQDGHAFVSSILLSVMEVVILLFRKMWLEVVHRTLETAGPAFIKWGQWAATRPDLFPKDLCTKLSELHSKAPEHSFAYTKKTIERAFGRKLSEIFEGFEEEPVASGSIAQIHRASLRFRYPGKRVKPMLVAVKVRHPGVGESIRRDFIIINSVAKLSNFIPTLNWLRLDESVQQFAVFMMSQVDLAREAANLNRFIYNFRSWKDVSFPKPVYPLVHPAVLVETYEQGESVAHYVDGFEGHDRIKTKLAHIGTHALLKMLLVDNFIHADMHPGNILVRVSQSKSSRKQLFKSKPHVIFLDVGMTAELSKSDRLNLLEFFKAVARRDGQTAAECTLRISHRQNCPNPKAFIEEVDEAFTFWGTPEGDLVHPAECMEQLLEKVRRHKVNIDGNVCTVLVTMLVLEGWQRKLDPGYNVMQTLQTLLLRADWAKSLSYTIDGLMAP